MTTARTTGWLDARAALYRFDPDVPPASSTSW